MGEKAEEKIEEKMEEKIEKKRVFKCAACSCTFEQEASRLSLRCPECWGKTLLLVEGPSLKNAKNCGGHCASCSCGCH